MWTSLGNNFRLLYLLLGIIICVAASTSFRIHAHPLSEEPKMVEMLMTIVVNKEPSEDVDLVFMRPNGEYLVPQDCLLKRYVKDKYLKNARVTLDGKTYVDLAQLTEAQSSFEREDLALHITFPEKYFNSRTFQGSWEVPPVDTRYLALGGLINYNFTLNKARFPKSQITILQGTPEVIFFSPYGIASSSFFVDSQKRFDSSHVIRLDTNWLHDWPKEMVRLVVGDSLTRPGSCGTSVRFGGIHLYRDFTMQPGFIPYPQPDIKGINKTPTLMDVFLNNTKLYEGHLPPGSFQVKDLPAVVGGGLLRVEQKDTAGHISTYEVPYYTSTTLLKEGLVDYSLEIGSKRELFMRESNRYRNPFVATLLRYGVTPCWTTGVRAEILKKFQNMSLSNQFLINRWSSLGFSVAGSRTLRERTFRSHSSQTGGLFSLNWNRHNNQVSDTGNFSYGVNASFNTRFFTDLSTYPFFYQAQLSLHSYFEYNHPRYGDFVVSFTSTRPSQLFLRKMHILNFSYKKQITSSLFVNVYGGKDFARKSERGMYILASINMSFDKDKNANLMLQRTQEGRQLATVSLAKQLVEINGWGYRLNTVQERASQRNFLAEQSHPQIYEAELQGRNYTGALLARASRFNQAHFYHLNAMGSIVAAGGEVTLTREAQQSMAVVKVGEFEGVRVYKDNQLIGRTNKNGLLLITEIPPYTSVTVRIDEEDLPLNSTLTHKELHILCPTRGAAYAYFDIKTSRSCMLKLITSENIDIPPGTRVTIDGIFEELIVGYDGELFIPDAHGVEKLEGKIFLSDTEYDWETHLPPLMSGVDEGVIELGKVICDTSV